MSPDAMASVPEAMQGFGFDDLNSAAGRPLANQDPDASAVIAEVFRRDGIDLRQSISLRSVTPAGPAHQHHRLDLDDGAKVRATHVLIAVGRRPPATDLGLDAAGVEVDDRGYIATDRHRPPPPTASMPPATSPGGCS